MYHRVDVEPSPSNLHVLRTPPWLKDDDFKIGPRRKESDRIKDFDAWIKDKIGNILPILLDQHKLSSHLHRDRFYYKILTPCRNDLGQEVIRLRDVLIFAEDTWDQLSSESQPET